MEYEERAVYRAYITDAARLITENTAKEHGGAYLSERYVSLITPKAPEKPEDPRPCIEIAADIWDRIKGETS